MGFYPASANQSVGGNLAVAGSITASGTISTTSNAFPAISALNGSMAAQKVSGTGAPASIDANIVGGGYTTKEGTNAKQGSATLVAGTVTVANTSITANSRILLGHTTPGGTPGALFASAVTVGTGFTITSTSSTDTSVVAYEIFEPG